MKNPTLFKGVCLPLTATLFVLLNTIYLNAQTWPCNNDFRVTRQVGTGTQVDFIRFGTGSTVSFSTQATTTNLLTNGSVYYNGYIWSMVNSPASNRLRKVQGNGTSVEYTIANLPSSSWNNAGVTKDGIMYMFIGSTFNLYAINLAGTTPAIVDLDPSSANYYAAINFGGTGGTASDAIYGDMVVDPATNQIYFWYHPNPSGGKPAGSVYGLYTLNVTAKTATRVGYDAWNVMGALFFDDAGRLFGYGTTPRTAIPQSLNQDRLFYIDKATGFSTQYGLPDIAVSQSDGCNCAFRLTLERTASATVVNVPKCSNGTFQYIFKTKNYTAAAQNGIILRDTLDNRLSYAFSTSAVQTQLQSLYGGSVSVSLANYNGGINNLLTITGLNIPTGEKSFALSVVAAGSKFAVSSIVEEQAYLDNIPTGTFLQTKEPSEYSITYAPKDVTPITINVINQPCSPPVANNFTNFAIPNTAAQTTSPPLTASDPDGTITQYTIRSLPLATQGILSLNGTAVGSNQVITAASADDLQFDPVAGFSGIAQFTFTATDNSGNTSNTATYKLPVSGTPPAANNIMHNSMVNTAGATSIVPLNATDIDGTVTAYTILSLPDAASGVLSVNGAALTIGQTLTPVQMTQLQFDPASGFIGQALFTYRATDDDGLHSNTANYTIPVTPTATVRRPPLANNIVAQSISNSEGAITIPSLKGSELNSTISSYTISTLPPVTAGTLYLCSGGCTPVMAGQLLTPSQANLLHFDPVALYTGIAEFTYTVTDNFGAVSNTAYFRIPVINTPPTASNITTFVSYNSVNALLPAIGGSDRDGTVAGYTITSIPASGTLRLCNPTCSNVALNQVILPADVANLKFTPASSFTGSTSFTYISTDNNGQQSAAATYVINIVNQPPVAADVIATTMANTNSSTAITALSATDPDGSINSYTIQSLPPASHGILYLSATPVTVGQHLSSAQINSLLFDPAANYTGVTSFTYSALDNTGNLSNVANYNIPVSGSGNLPPITRNIVTASMPNTNGATAISALSGTDPNGGIASYTVLSIPPTSQGILSVSGTAVTAGQTLTTAQASQLQFDPNVGFAGNVTFTYLATDNNSTPAQSNIANYTISVTNLPPVAQPIVAPSMPNTNTATGIPTLSAADPDGTIATYTIEILPPASQGVLQVNGVPVTAGQVLAAAQAAQLQFAPASGYVGDVLFNYHATDNSDLNSNSTTYTVPVTNRSPIAEVVVSPKLVNSSAATTIAALSGLDEDGTIVSYTIRSLPPASQGMLTLNGVAVTVGQTLSTAQAAALQFAPSSTYNGEVIFNYAATDNNGNISNLSTYLIPVGSELVLPVSFVAVKAAEQANGVLVTWTVANETDIARYEVEKSTDGTFFNKIGTVSFTASAASTQQYSFLDGTPAQSNYYRIREVDMDGKFTFSKVVSVRFTGLASLLSVYPNPVQSSSLIRIQSARNQAAAVYVSDVQGRVVIKRSVQLQKGSNLLPAHFAKGLAAGEYVLSILFDGRWQTVTFIK